MCIIEKKDLLKNNRGEESESSEDAKGAFTLVLIFCTIMFAVAIIAAIITGELQLW